MVLGTFGVRVLTGEVTILGSFIRPSETVHWVSAPHCYAVPVLRTSENTSLELHNDHNTNSLRGLGPLSPLFRGIWNEASASSRRSTFQIVRPPVPSTSVLVLTVTSCTPQTMLLRGASSKISSPLLHGIRSSPPWLHKLAGTGHGQDSYAGQSLPGNPHSLSCLQIGC